MRLLCRQFIEDGLFTLVDLNSKIQSFCYNSSKASDRPPVITKSHLDSEQLPMDAVQAWCFVRIFDFAVGGFVDRDNQYWLLYLQLRQMMEIICARYVQRDEIELFRVTIAEYLEMHTKLFPTETLKNKHHHLIHYPRLIAESGPLSRLWCLRFESKHQRPKTLLHISGNFEDVLRTLAMRHQLDAAFNILKD
jgi:hypothetical protein